MQPTASPASTKPVNPSSQDEAIRHLPAPAQEAFRRFQANGNEDDLDLLMLAILDDFIPRSPVRPLAEMPGGTQLMADLGFDSLAITEVVFFTEDLLGIRIANEEIVQVRTLDDLRGFLRRKVAARRAG